jgi:hypothetical protein
VAVLRPGSLSVRQSVGEINEISGAAEIGWSCAWHCCARHAPEVAAGWQPFLELDDLLAGARERRGNASEVWEWLLHGGLKRPTLAVAEAAVLFDEVEVTSTAYAVEETADEWGALSRTTSLCQRIAPPRREPLEEDATRLIEGLGGTIRSRQAVLLMTARRSPRRL